MRILKSISARKTVLIATCISVGTVSLPLAKAEDFGGSIDTGEVASQENVSDLGGSIVSDGIGGDSGGNYGGEVASYDPGGASAAPDYGGSVAGADDVSISPQDYGGSVTSPAYGETVSADYGAGADPADYGGSVVSGDYGGSVVSSPVYTAPAPSYQRVTALQAPPKPQPPSKPLIIYNTPTASARASASAEQKQKMAPMPPPKPPPPLYEAASSYREMPPAPCASVPGKKPACPPPAILAQAPPPKAPQPPAPAATISNVNTNTNINTVTPSTNAAVPPPPPAPVVVSASLVQPVIRAHPVPSVSLTQIPYTGIETDFFTPIPFLAGLLALSGFFSYLALYYKGGMPRIFTRAARHIQNVAPQSPKKIEANKNTLSVRVITRGASNLQGNTVDTMYYAATSGTEIPRIAIMRR